MKKRIKRLDKSAMMGTGLLLAAWCDAANDWRRLRSDPAEARCRAARSAYYLAAWGYVPALAAREETAA